MVNHMKTIALVLLGLALLLPAFAADDFAINVYPAPRADTAPVLDGKLDEPVWQQAPLVSGLTLYGKTDPVDVQSSFRLLWDDEYLYLGIRNDEPNMDKFAPLVYAHDEHAVFSGEAIEFFVDANHTHDVYYQLAFNMLGSLYDGLRSDVTWNSQAVLKGTRDADGWTVEFAVPWSTLGAKPAPGKVIGFNVNRDRQLGDGRQWSTWARVQGGFHDPDRFAHAVLSGSPEQIGKLSSELRKGQRTGPIVVFSQAGFAQTSYKELSQASLKRLEDLLQALLAEQKLERDPQAAAELERRLESYRQQADEYRLRANAELDAADWIRLDRELQKTMGELHMVVWEARLSALLSGI